MDGLAFVQMIESELKKRNIPKEQFYRESGISSATMSQWRKRIYSPSSAAIKKIEEYLGVVFSIEQKGKTPANVDRLSIEKLNQFVGHNPDACSGKRLNFLFTASDYDLSTVCFNLGIDQYYLDNWMQDNDLPPKPIIDKILGVFHLKPEDLFPAEELSEYSAESQEWGTMEKAPAVLDRRLPEKPNQNIIRIAGRDGSYRERTVTDEQLALFAAMFDQLPDVPDDL